MQAFREIGLPIDSGGGTSIGALIAVLFAMGFREVDLEDRALETVTRSGRVIDRTLPIMSLSSAPLGDAAPGRSSIR